MSGANSLVVQENALPATAAWESKIDLIKRTVANGATNDELDMFLYQARRSGLDPLSRQIYAIKRKGKMTIQVGIDGFRLIAHRTGAFAGADDAVFEGEAEGGHPAKATVTVYRIVQGIRCAFTATARWSEYYPGDEQGFQWRKMPHVMLGKCAEALALRKAFPQELSGLYITEEMQQAGPGDSYEVDPSTGEVKSGGAAQAEPANWLTLGRPVTQEEHREADKYLHACKFNKDTFNRLKSASAASNTDFRLALLEARRRGITDPEAVIALLKTDDAPIEAEIVEETADPKAKSASGAAGPDAGATGAGGSASAGSETSGTSSTTSSTTDESPAPPADEKQRPENPRGRYFALHAELGWPDHGDSKPDNKRVNHEAWSELLGSKIDSGTQLTNPWWKRLANELEEIKAGTKPEPAAIRSWREDPFKDE